MTIDTRSWMSCLGQRDRLRLFLVSTMVVAGAFACHRRGIGHSSRALSAPGPTQPTAASTSRSPTDTQPDLRRATRPVTLFTKTAQVGRSLFQFEFVVRDHPDPQSLGGGVGAPVPSMLEVIKTSISAGAPKEPVVIYRTSFYAPRYWGYHADAVIDDGEGRIYLASVQAPGGIRIVSFSPDARPLGLDGRPLPEKKTESDAPGAKDAAAPQDVRATTQQSFAVVAETDRRHFYQAGDLDLNKEGETLSVAVTVGEGERSTVLRFEYSLAERRWTRGYRAESIDGGEGSR
jgi:hypothetical protein